MESIAFFLVLVVGLGSFVFALWPLRGAPRAESGLLASPDGALAEGKELALTALEQLDRDYALGGLVESDYAHLRRQLEARAIRALQAEDAEARVLEDALEREVLRLREQLRSMGADRSEDALTLSQRERGSGRVMPLPLGEAGRVRQRRTRTGDGRLFDQATSALRPRIWLGGGAALAVALAVGVIYLYRSAPAQVPSEPIGTLPTPAVRALAMDPLDTNRVWVATGGSLLASADGGRTWQPVEVGDEPIAVAASSFGPIYVAARNGIWRSADRPASGGWKQAGTGPPGGAASAFGGLAVSGVDAATLYAFGASGLYRSDDGGASWGFVGGGLPQTTTSLAVAPSSGSGPILFAATLGEGVLSSPDGGVRWGNASGFVTGALPTRVIRGVAYDPKSGDEYRGPDGRNFRGALYVGTDQGLFKSTDAGTSWIRLPLEAPLRAVAVSPADSRVVVAIDDGGRVFRSRDRGLTWTGGG